MFLFVFAALVMTQGCFDMSGATDRQGFATHKPSLQDAIPAGDLLFETTERTKTACSLQCLGHDGCEAFTYRTPSATCLGHSSVNMSSNVISPSPGAETWTFSHGIPCPVNCDYQLVAPGVYFRLYMTAQTHAAARAQCQQDGATLYRMKTEERRQLLKDFALSQGIQATDMLWLDGDRMSGAYRWGDGDTLGLTDDSSLWYSGQPDLTGECVKTIGNFRLDDKNCQVPYMYVCEL